MEDNNYIIETNNQKIYSEELAQGLYIMEQLMIVSLEDYKKIENKQSNTPHLVSTTTKILTYKNSLYLLTRNQIFTLDIDKLIEYYNNSEGIL